MTTRHRFLRKTLTGVTTLAILFAFLTLSQGKSWAADPASPGDKPTLAQSVAPITGTTKPADKPTPADDDFVGDDDLALKETKADQMAKVPDPWQKWNRFWFEFNDRLYFWVMKPVAKGYKNILPEIPRTWVSNFFHNLLYPVRFVNCLFQGKLLEAGAETSRFIGNTAFGFGGISNFAHKLETVTPMRTAEEDFGQTLGVWGAGHGLYLVWPFIGPSTVRDTVGLAADTFLSPTTYLNPWYYSMGTKAYEKINETSFRIGEYETIKEGSVEPYLAVRDAYIRYRNKQTRE